MGGEKHYPIYFHLLKGAVEMVAVQGDVLSQMWQWEKRGRLAPDQGNAGNRPPQKS